MGSFCAPYRLALNAGFTLIEMLVSLGILTVIAAVVLSSHASFSNSIIIQDTVYDVALSLRNTESYGIGSRGYGSIVNTGYGLDFAAAAPSSYSFFADTYPAAVSSAPTAQPGDGIYTAAQDALITTYHLNDGISLSYFCGSGGLSTCSSQSGGPSRLDIVFTRPNANPSIIGIEGSSAVSFSSACLAFTSRQGTLRYISVANDGLISAVASSCP